MRFMEIEVKHNAKKISLEAFRSVNHDLLAQKYPGQLREQRIASYDHYAHDGESERFLRHRDGPDPQLTTKAKTSDRNNFRRRETNVHLALGVEQSAEIAELCDILGLNKKFSLYKDAEIFWFDRFNTVYYVIYEDASCKRELGRYVEIEMSESVEWESEDQAWTELQRVEELLAPLGISPQTRIRKSLFEIFRNA